MNQSIVKRLLTAACAVAVVSSLSAQSAPVEVRSVQGGHAHAMPPSTQDPKPAQKPADATDRVQLRLAEVMAMLEEDDMTPEQQLRALAKLTEVAERLKQERQQRIVYRNYDGAVAAPVAPGQGEAPTRTTVGRRIPGGEGQDKPAQMRAIGVPMPPEPPAPPTPGMAPKPPKPPAPPQVWVTAPETKAGEAAPPRRLVLSVSPDGKEREVAVVDQAQVENRKKRVEQALAKAEADVAKAKEEVARLQRIGRETAVQAQRVKAQAERAKAEAAAKQAHDEARAVEEHIRVAREHAARSKSAPRVAERAPSSDDEIRATIEEMRAEMQEIRKLMQEIRARAQRESQRESQREAVPEAVEVREVRGEPVRVRKLEAGR